MLRDTLDFIAGIFYRGLMNWTDEQIAREFEVLKEIEEVRATERQGEYHGGLKETFPGVQNIEAVTEKGQARDMQRDEIFARFG